MGKGGLQLNKLLLRSILCNVSDYAFNWYEIFCFGLAVAAFKEHKNSFYIAYAKM